MSNKDKNVFEALGISDPEPVEKSKPLTVEDIIKKGSEQQGLGPLPRARGTGMGKLNKFDTDLLPNIDLVTNRARNQTTISKIGRTVGNLIPNIGANLVEYAGYAGELIGYGISELSDEEYKTDFTNAVTEWAKEARNPLGEAHRYNNDVFDLDDWSWWLNNGSGLVESIGSFLITGAGVGKGAMWVAGKVAGRVTKGMKSARAIRYTEMGTSGAGQAFTAGTLAYFEGAMSGAEMYDQVRREVYDKTGDPVEATKTAAESAALTTMTSTAIVTALNLTSFYPLFKSRGLMNKGSKWNLLRKPEETNKAFAQRMAKAQTNPSRPTQEFYSKFATALEVPQEAAEEVSNLYAEARGRQEAGISDTDATGFDLWTETLMTEEGVLAALLGGIGGAAQTAGMMNLPMHRRNVADPEEDPDIQWLSRKELESIDETKAGATYAKSLEADIRDIIKAQEELETAMSNKDEAGAEIARLKLFDVASKRSIPIDGGEAVKQSLREIAEMDNETDLLSEATKQLEALSGQEPTQETQMKTDQLTQQIEALNTWADARGIDPANGITEAMQLGLAENQKDNEYKEKAENKLTEVDEMKEEYLATMGKYNYGDEQALGLAEYVFDLQNRRQRAESNVEFIDTQLANLEAEISKISSDILPDDLVGEAGEEVAAMRLGAKRDAIRENLEEFKEEKRQAEKGNKQLLQEYKAQTKEQALQEINKSIKQTEEQLKALDERVSQIVPSLYAEAQKTFNMRKSYKDGLKAKDKATKTLRALTRRLAFVESNEGRADFVKKAFEAYKSEVKIQEEIADKLDTKDADEDEQAGVSEARVKKEPEKKASKPEPKPETDTDEDEQDPNKLQDLSSLMKGESKPDNTQDREDTTDIAGKTPSDTTGDGENVNAKDSTDKILTLTEDITEATEKKRDPEYRPKAIAGNKIQYGNVQDYVEIVDDDGTARKVTSADGRNTIVEPRLESKINSLRGTDVRISVDENYAGNTIDEDGNTVDNVPTDLYNKPMKIETVDGKLLGYVPQLTWITRQDEAGNYVNIADFQTESGYSNAHLQKEIVKLIRETVDKEGSISRTINDISQGVPLYNRTEDGKRVKGPASELLPDPEFSMGVVKAGIANYGEGRPSVPVQKNMKDGTVVGNYAGVSMPMWIREISAEDAQIIKKAIVAKATNNEEAIKEISDVVENIDEPIAFDSVAGLAELISRKVYTSRFDRKSLSKAPNPDKVFFHVDPQSGFVHLARPNDGTIYTTNPGKVDQEGYEPLVVDGGINPEAAEYIDKFNSNVRRSHLNTEGPYDDISIVDGKVDAVTYNSYNEYAKTLLDSFIDGRNTIEHPEIGTEYLYWQQQVNSYDYTGVANSTVTKPAKEPAKVIETVEQEVDEVSQQTEEDLDPTPDDDPFYRPKQGRKSLKDLENERSSNSNNPYSDSDTIDVGFPATVDEKLDKVLSRYNIGGFSHSQVSQVVDSIMLAVREKISNTEGDVPPTVQETLEEAKNRFMDQYSNYKDASDEARTDAFRDILKTWDKFADRAVNHLKAIGFEPVEGGVIEGEQSNYEKTKYEDKARWQQNSKDTASAQLKLFLSQIPRQSYNISGDNKVLVTRKSEWLGLDTYVPLDEIYDKMTALFVDTTPKFDNMMEILKEAGQDYPPYMTVYNQLKNLPPTSTLKAEFQRVMSKQYIDMVIALFNPQYDDLGNLTGYESKPVHSDRNSAIDLIYGEWVENMKDSDLIKNVDGSLVIDHEEANRIKEEYIEKMDGQSVLKNREVVRGLLESIGVELAEATWKTILRNNNKALVTDGNLSDNFKIIDGKPVNNTFLDILFKTLPTETPQDFETGNPLAGDSMKSRFRKLASFEYNHSDKVYTSSYNDINNNNIYPYQMNTFLSDRIRDMKSKEELREILGKLSFSKYSRWIQNPDKVTLEYTDGLKNQLTKRGNSGSDLGQIDTDLLSVTMYFGTVNQTRGEFGRFQTTTKSDKTMFPIIKAPRVAPTVKVDGDTGEITKFLGKQTSKGARLAIRNLIKAEFGRIYNFRTSVEQQLKNQGIDLGGYMEGARHFILLPELNAEVAETYIDKGVITREEFNRVWKGGFAHLQQATDSTDFAINIMQKVVEARILEESKALFEDWKTNGIVRESARNVPTADGGTKKVNTLSSFLDANYLRYQTPYSKAESRLHYAALDFTLNHHLNMAEEYMVVSGDPAQFWKKSKEGGLMNDIRSTIENLNKRLAKDIAPKSDGLYDDPTFRMIAIVDPELDSKQMDELGEAYGGMEIADAQEYTTVVEHLRNMKAEGKISPAKYDELLAVVEPGQYYEFTPEQMGDIFSPTKPVYVGDHVLSEEYDVNLMSYTKSSAFPLLPQFLKGFELDKLRTAMETQKVDRASYMTANKLGAVNPVNIFDGREIKKDLTFGDSVRSYNRSGFGLQQEVPVKDKTVINVVSQANKLLFASIRNTEGFKFEGSLFTGRELEVIKENIRNTLLRKAEQELYDKLGAEIVDGDMQFDDLTKVHELLKSEAEGRGWTISAIESIQLSEDKQSFILPLALSSNAGAIESLLLSQVSNITLGQKVHGYSYVQGSSAGLVGYDTAKNEGIDFTPTAEFQSTGLNFISEGEDSTEFADIIVPWRFKDDQGNPLDINDFTDENGVIDSKKLPEEVRRLIGLRIPNQGHNSMLPMRIVGFLPRNVGTLAIVPEEIVAQMGSDFDVDKLYTYQPKSEYKMTADGGHRLERIKGNVFEVNSEEFIEIPSNAPVSEIESVELFTTKVDQFNYTFNPETGEVIHNAKKGDKVETRNTQIGKVLAAYSNENNLPTEEFNNQTYAKVGDRVVNVNNSNIVTDPNIVSKFDDSSDIEEGVDSIQQTGLTEDNQALLEDVLSSFEIGLGVTLVEDFGSKDRGQMASVNKNQEVKLAIDRITAESFIEYLYGEDETDSLTTKQKREVTKRLDAQGITREDVENLVQNKRDAVSFILLHEKSHVDNKDFQNYEIASVRDQLEADEITPEEYRMSEPMLAIETRATVDAFRELTQFKEDEVAPIFKAREVELNYTSDQQVALSKAGTFVDSFRESGNRHFLLAGYAGTGKTTIAENIANYAISKGIPVTVSAPTNAAVEVVRNKFSGTDFKTLHSMLYGAPNPITGKWEDPKVPDNTLIIVDEASMIDQDLLDDIVKGAKKANSKIVFLGDSYQLEPVGVDPKLFENFDFGDNRTELQEVKRIDNGVLKVATHIRNTKSSKPQILDINNDDFAITERFGSELAQDIKEDNDFVVLTTTNRERVQNNNSIRRNKYGKESSNPIVDGETLVAVANNTKKNSQVFTVNDPVIEQSFTETVYKKEHEFHLVRYTDDTGQTRRVLLAPNLDQASLHGYQLIYGTQGKSRFDTSPFSKSDGDGKISWKKSIDIATYGYSLTIHKSQGSQWDNVYVEIPWMHKDWDAGRMIYTAITRAAKKVRLKETHYIQKVPVDQYRESRGFPIKSDQLEDALKYTEDSSLEAIDAFNSQPRTPRRSDMVRETGEDADLETFSTDDLMDMYFRIFESVLSHPSMYEKLKSPLDKDDLLTERALIESVQKGSQAVASPASYRGQRDYRLNQRSGQKLVGIGALANTLNAVIQDKQKANLELQEVVENEPRAMTIDVNIGGKDVFLSTLSGEGTSKYNGEVRTKGDNISLFLTAAVDNANLNILGPINWNTYTAGAVVTLLMLEDSKGNAVDLGYAAKFTSQPIVREMVAEAEKLNSASSEESSLDAVPTAINTVISEYKTKVKGEFKRVIVSDKDLKDMLDLPPLEEMTSQQASRQISVLMTFRELNEVSQDVRELQQAILSPESDGTDNRAIQALRRAKEAEQVREGGLGKIANTRDLMFNIEGDYSEQSVSMDVIYNNTKKLVSSLLPEYTKYFEPTVDVLSKLTGRNYSNDQLTTIWRETRKYLNSGFKEMELGDVSAIRSRLIFGDEETAPLANRLQEAKNTWGKEDYFLQRLLVEKSTKPGEVPSTIKFQADKSIRLDDSNNSTALASMLKSGVEEERKLAEDLVLYDLVTGGVQGAVQYSKYIPPAYLEYLGIKKAFNADYDANISAMQILQHNPKLATRIDGDSPIVNDVIKSKNGIDGILIAPITSAVSDHLTYQSDEGLEYPGYISMFDNTRKTFSLFKHGSTSSNGTVRFNRVATLGQPNVSEYQTGTVIGESILTNDVVKRPAEPVNRGKGRTKPNDVGLLEDLGPFKDIIPADRVTVEGNTLKTDITYFEFMEMVDFDEEHKPVAEALIKYIKDVKTPIDFVNSASNSRSASVMFTSTKNKDENTVEVTLENIFIYPDKFNIEKLQEIVLHEAVHIATVKAIYENKLPAVAKLNALYHTAKRELITRGEFEEYQITNLAEFVAFAMTNKDFQKKLNDIPFENKTARDRFKNLIIDLITTITEAMGITVNPGSVLEQTIGNVISLMEDSVVGEDSDVKATPQDTRNVSNKGLGELGFPAFGDIDPTVEKIAQTLTTRISTIKAKMLKSNDVKKSQELEKALDRVQTQLSNLVNNATADGIIAVAKAQAEWAKEIASDKRSSDSVFATAKDTTRSWDYEITQDYLKPQQRRNDNPIREALYQADLIMQPARDAINNAMLLRMRDLVNKDMPKDQHISVKSLQFMEDIGYSTQYFLDISQVDNQLAQYLFELLATNARAAGTELLQFDQKLNEQLDKMEDEDWEVFKQKDEEGNWTGDFIDEYSSKYYAREKGIISSYKAKLRKAETLDPQSATRLKNAASILYHKEINELRETVDTRMLLVKGYQSPIWGSKKEYISYLEEQYGKQKAQSMVQQAEMQYQEYKRARRVKKDDLAVDYVSASTELSEEAWIEQELKNWELKNDPMRALDEKFGVVGEKITNYYAETAADYLVAVPRAKDKRGKSTGFYDSAFEKLTDNQRDFYNFYINSISKLQKFLPRYDTRDLTRNFFPRVQKDLIEEYNTGGLKGSLRYANEALVNSISAGRTAELRVEQLSDYQEIDPATGKPKNTIDVLFTNRKIETDKLSFNVPATLRMFAGMAINYKWKSSIEDRANLVMQVVRDAKRIETRGGKQLFDRHGDPVSLREGAIKLTEVMGYSVEAIVYNEKRQEYKESNIPLFDTWNPFTNHEKRVRMRELENKRDELEEQLENREVSQEDYTDAMEKMEQEYRDLGGKNLVWGKLGDRLLEYTQLKGMGYNLTAGIANVGFGVLSNATWAASGRDFTGKELTKAYGLITRSLLPGGSMKIANLVKLWNILFEVTETEYGKSSDKEARTKSKRFNFISNVLTPYAIQRRTEYIVQAASMVAQMLNKKITVTDNKTGEEVEIDLFEAYDEKANWKERYSQPDEWKTMDTPGQSLTEFARMQNKMIQVNKYLHGNYDPNSSILLKKYLVGRLLGQFRSWIPYGFKQRIGKGQYDRMLGRTFKGRYRTLYDIGFTKSIRGLIGSAIHADEFAYGKKGTKDRLSDVDIDNLKMALREMQVLISLMATAALLKAAFEDLDDDDFLKGAGYVAINQLYRVEQDIYFYLSPNTFEEILRNPIPVMQVYSDFERAMTSSANYIMDSDFEGSRVAKDWGRALPLANQLIKTDYLSKNLQ